MCREGHQDPQQDDGVLGVLKGHSTRIVADFADVDRRTVQLRVARFDKAASMASRTFPGGTGFRAQCTGGSGDLQTGLSA